MAVSVEQAAANALGRWLVSQLPASEVTVDTRWPEASVDMPTTGITILLAGPPDEEPLDPVVVADAPIDATHGMFTWRLAALRQPLQMDVWTRYDLARDDILARLVPLLHAGMRASVGAYNANPVRHGVLVPLSDGWDGYADCFFDRPQRFDSPGAVQRCEYRATYRGWADVDLTITAPSARLARLFLVQRIRDAEGSSARTTTVTPAGATTREG
jgi:hypothetical protein